MLLSYYSEDYYMLTHHIISKGTPYVPTAPEKIALIFDDLLHNRISGIKNVVDMGSGDGRFVVRTSSLTCGEIR